jgi:hypothetical protein
MVCAVAGKSHQCPFLLTPVYRRPVRTVTFVHGIARTFLSVKTLKWTLDIVLTGETHWLPYVPLLTFFAVCVFRVNAEHGPCVGRNGGSLLHLYTL